MNRTFYHHRGVRITDQWVVIDDRRFPLATATGFRTTTGPSGRPAVRILGAGVTLLVAAAVLSPLLPLLTTLALGLVGGLSTAIGAIAVRVWPRASSLWIGYDDGDVLVLTSTDAIELGKATRALRRAFEQASPPRRMWAAA